MHNFIQEDRKKFSAFFFRYNALVHRLVYKILGPIDESDDVIQEIFIQMYRSLPTFKGEAKLSTWIYRIGINVCTQYIRRKNLKKNAFQAKANRNIDTIASKRHLDGESYTERREQQHVLYRALNTLHPKKRVVIVLHDIDNKTMEEIADIINVPVGTVKSRLFHARDEMKTVLSRIWGGQQ
jgi:RNA polymerase sigma-70 factor (ECF subfamily)